MMYTRILLLFLLIFYPTVTQAGLFHYQDKATGLYGFKNAAGKVMIPPQFIAVSESHEEVFSPKTKRQSI